jgi:hypothetical protein
MDVGVGRVYIADAEFAAGFRHDLHQANRTDAASTIRASRQSDSGVTSSLFLLPRLDGGRRTTGIRRPSDKAITLHY